MELPPRKKRILKAIVESYIDTAEPVGSKMLAASFDSSISSATVRNEMSELEELGYLEKPHVSAGRVPSYTAYRLYVNELMDRHKVAFAEMEAARAEMMSKMREIDNILISASKAISEMTNHTALSMISRSNGETIKKAQLITADGGQSYAIVLLTDADAKHRMVRLAQPVEQATAQMLTTAVNLALEDDKCQYLLDSIAQSSGTTSQLYILAKNVMDFIEFVSEEHRDSQIYIDGASRLLNNREYQDAGRARELLEYIGNQDKLRKLFDNKGDEPISIMIGPELGDPGARDAGLVFTSYRLDKNTRGIIGIVAPARMDYATVSAKLYALAQVIEKMGTGIKQIEKSGETKT